MPEPANGFEPLTCAYECIFGKSRRIRGVSGVSRSFAWLAPFLWRLDADWKGLRHQTPWVGKPPSEYVWEHVRFTSQPLEEPEHPSLLLEVFKWNRAERTLMFASDYAHWDFDSPPDEYIEVADLVTVAKAHALTMAKLLI